MISALRRLHEDSLLRNSFYIILGTAVLAGFGFLFWLFSARLVSPESIGIATTFVSVMNMIAVLSLIGFDAAFVRFLSRAEDKNAQLNTGIILVAGASSVLGALFVLVVPFLSPQLAFIQNEPLLALLFILFCVFCAINILTDAIFLAYRETRFTFVINTILSIIKVALPFFFAPFGAFGIFAAAAAAQGVGCFLSIAVLMRTFDYRPRFAVDREILKRIRQYSTHNYIAGVLNMAPMTVLPLLIINRLGPASAAYYYIVMMIGGLLYVIPQAITRSLFAEGSHDADTLSAQTAKAIRTIAFLLTPAVVVLLAAGDQILGVFGADYATGGLVFLYLIALSGFVVGLNSLLGMLLRIKRDVHALVAVNLFYACAVIGLSFFLLPRGLPGIGMALVVGTGLTAGVSYLFYGRKNFHDSDIQYDYSLITWLDYVQYDLRTMFLLRLQYWYARARRGFTTKTILFYPDHPLVFHSLYRVCYELGYTMTTDPHAKADLVIAYQDVTVRDNARIEELFKDRFVVNRKCTDIGKDHVEAVFQKVFGYGMAVDPRTCQGVCVRKSIDNAVHDGKVIVCRSEPEEGYIYQKLINNTHGEGSVYDIRVTIIGEEVALVVLRYRSLSDRFDNTQRVVPVELNDVLSTDEQKNILAYSKAFGLDCGEMDILRDSDGRIFIVDVNPTSSAPRPGVLITRKDFKIFKHRMNAAFESNFLRA